MGVIYYPSCARRRQFPRRFSPPRSGRRGLKSASPISRRLQSMPWSMRRTGACLAAAGSMGPSTAPPDRICWRNAGRLAPAKPDRQKLPAAIGYRQSTSSMPWDQSGGAEARARKSCWHRAIAALSTSLPRTGSHPWRFPRYRRESTVSRRTALRGLRSARSPASSRRRSAASDASCSVALRRAPPTITSRLLRSLA